MWKTKSEMSEMELYYFNIYGKMYTSKIEKGVKYYYIH